MCERLCAAVINQQKLSTVPASYLKDLLHISVVNKALLPPLRIGAVTVRTHALLIIETFFEYMSMYQ